MAQKKKSPQKSKVAAKPSNVRSAASAKPARKIGETKVTGPAKKAVKPILAAKPAAPAAKLHTKPVAKAPGKPAANPVIAKPIENKIAVASKAPEKKAIATKPAAPVKPVATAKPVAKPVAAAPAKAAAPVKPAAAPVAAATPAAAAPQMTRPVAPAAKPAGMPSAAVAAATGTIQPTAQRTVPSAMPKPALRTFPMPNSAHGAGSPRDIAQKAVDARQQQITSAAAAAAKKPVTARHGFKINESIVYPAHGVGRIIAIEEQEIAGFPLELFVIQFEKDKMTLRVPTSKLQSVGMRKLAEDDIVSRAMDTLKGRARVKRTMWSRRAQEYEAKINSGDLISIAEVVRDLYRSESQPEQSYSERQLYEAALDRMAREIAAVGRIDERGATQRISEVLAKSAKGRRAAETPAITDDSAASDAKAA